MFVEDFLPLYLETKDFESMRRDLQEFEGHWKSCPHAEMIQFLNQFYSMTKQYASLFPFFDIEDQESFATSFVIEDKEAVRSMTQELLCLLETLSRQSISKCIRDILILMLMKYLLNACIRLSSTEKSLVNKCREVLNQYAEEKACPEAMKTIVHYYIF